MDNVNEVEVVLFDFDGVLAYLGKNFFLPLSVFKKILDINKLDSQKIKGGFYVNSSNWINELANLGINVNEQQGVQRISELMFEYFKDRVKLFDWVPEIIPKLAKIKKLAILSNNSYQSVSYHLGDLENYFCCVKTYEQCWPHLKPSSNGIRLICEELNIKPSRCFMLGDSKEDILAAEEAGAPFGLVNWGKQIKSRRKTLTKLYKKKLFPNLVTKEFNNPHQLIPYFREHV
jgi:HAD superfamily hydrolase (TIGR01549 family)